jgi:outer membrane lipoprotein SlyB
MNTPHPASPKNGAHPIMIIAGIAIVLFCAVGVAAIMGWIPTSIGGNAGSSALTEADKAAMAPVPAPPMIPQTPARRAEAAPRHQPHQSNQSNQSNQARQQRQAPGHEANTAPARQHCANCGVVESTRVVNERAEGSGVGAAGGAVVGGMLGNQVGGGRGKDLATVVGAIGGAVAGNQIEGQVKATRSYEVVVRLNDGSTRTIKQTNAPAWNNGDEVRIVDGVIHSRG